METTYIYGLFDPRDCSLRYIGKADNPKERLVSHIYETRTRVGYNLHKERWIRKLLSEGLEPSVEILEEVHKSKWQKVERAWIKEAKEKGLRLTNIARGGDGGATRFGPRTQETIAKIRLSKQNIKAETRKRLSDSGKKGWPKRRESGFGHITEEQKKKIGNALRGKQKSLEIKEKMRNAQLERRRKEKELGIVYPSPNKGRVMSEEQKIKISETLKGKPLSEETKKKISKALKGRPAPNKGKKK